MRVVPGAGGAVLPSKRRVPAASWQNQAVGVGAAVSGAEWVTRLGLPPSLPFAALAFALRFDLREPRIEPMLIGFQQWGQVVIVR